MAWWFVVAMTAQYGVASVLYVVKGDYWRALYWLGAVVINIAVINLEGGN